MPWPAFKPLSAVRSQAHSGQVRFMSMGGEEKEELVKRRGMPLVWGRGIWTDRSTWVAVVMNGAFAVIRHCGTRVEWKTRRTV